MATQEVGEAKVMVNSGLTEIRPGTYVCNDFAGLCSGEFIVLTQSRAGLGRCLRSELQHSPRIDVGREDYLVQINILDRPMGLIDVPRA